MPVGVGGGVSGLKWVSWYEGPEEGIGGRVGRKPSTSRAMVTRAKGGKQE